MKIAACIVTRNRTEELEKCLAALWRGSVEPHIVVVSDDSKAKETQLANATVVEKYPGTLYLKGPQNGVCANRNNAARAVKDSDYIAFVDDDICLDSQFLALALERYGLLEPQAQENTILTGTSVDHNGYENQPSKLSFRGYFVAANPPQAVNVHAALFPRQLLDEEPWDELIYFGYEDAELCLRAIKRGYDIIFCPELKAFHSCSGKRAIASSGIGLLKDSDIFVESARLYVGIKRYSKIQPNSFKLLCFAVVYVVHMTIFLLRKRAITAWPMILSRSQLNHLWRSNLA